MRITSAIYVAAAAVIGALVWWTMSDPGRAPYSVDSRALTGWTIAAGDPDGVAFVSLVPPRELGPALLQQVQRRASAPLVASARPSIPLVLRSEYDDSLQGVFGVEDVVRKARDAGLETARITPICMGHRHSASHDTASELFFVRLDVPGFADFRADLMPFQPEHGGTGVYDPAALLPVLTVAASDRDFARWWPFPLDARDCESSIAVIAVQLDGLR